MGREGGGVQSHSSEVLAPGMTQYPLYRRMDGPQRQSGSVRKIWPLGIYHRTDLSVASSYSDYDVQVHLEDTYAIIICTYIGEYV